ncbi:MAG TPA: hypothetical protein VHD63_00950 [Ktedonobacteraceae bacterium]|nr:hypothetical protein [Ktedonobacteraceae bacterium]
MTLADLFTLSMNIGSGLFTLAIDIGKSKALADFLAISISLGGYTITYNLLDFLIILAISVVAAVLVEKVAHQTTPGGFLGAFLIALIGIWIFITFIPLTWNKDFRVPSTHVPLITSFIGAIISILIVHFFKVVFGKKGSAAKA